MPLLANAGFAIAVDDTRIATVAIASIASNEGYRAASRKYYGLTPNAEKIYLSTKPIKQIESYMKKLASDVVEHMPYYFAFVTFMINTAKSDPKLYEELKRLDQKYDRLIRDDLLIKG